MKFQNLINDVIGVRNPYGLIHKAGKKTRRKTRTKRRNKSRTKSLHLLSFQTPNSHITISNRFYVLLCSWYFFYSVVFYYNRNRLQQQ